MKKETLLTVMAIAIMISSNSCSDWQNLATTEFGNENLQKACENSKGTYNSDLKRCVCNNIECDDGVICVKNDNNQNEYICAGRTGDSFEKMCVSSGGKYSQDENSKEARCICKTENGEVTCDHGVVCEAGSNGCAGRTGDSFEKMCVSSGGSIENGNCLCNSMICDKGVVCATSRIDNQTTCANKFGNCSSDDENQLKCVDDNNYMCVNNRLNSDSNTTNYEWLFVSKCKNGCIDNECKDICNESEANCSENYDFLLKCNGNSVAPEYCPLRCNSELMKCNEKECENENSYQCDSNGVLQICKNYKWINVESCLNSCIEDGKTAFCGVCKNGNTRCITEEHGTRGIPQTCKNGKWKNDTGDDECTDGNCLCDGNASCTITKENRDDGTEVEKSTCGICQNDVDMSCVYDSKEQHPRTGYRASCKNGIFEKIATEVCPNGNSCKLSKDLTKCESNSCECGSGEEKEHCSKGQYCKEELVEGAIHRKCVNGMSRCEDNVCICGNVVCNRGEFCTVDEELNDACVTALKCEDSECPCGENKCKNGDYCKENAICVDASEVITGIDWACGDCQNTVSDKYSVTLNQCGSDIGQDNCHTSALTILDQDVIRDCMNSAVFEQCIEKSFHAACDIQSCKIKTDNCDKVLSDCYSKTGGNNLEKIEKCGVVYDPETPKRDTLYYAIKQSDKCEQESCDCGSQSCLKGQFCFFNSECIDEERINIAGVLDYDKKNLFVCQCSGSGCACSCGEQECHNRQICVGNSASTQECKNTSEMKFTYVYKCQDKSCPNCDKDDNCCDIKGNCVDVGDTKKYVSVYEFVDSEAYICRSLKGQCDTYLDGQNKCLESSYSVYKNCLLDCTNSETKDKCQKMCIEDRSSRDDNCLNEISDILKSINNLGDQFSGCFYQKDKSNTSCYYECRSGRRMPFDGINDCPWN